MDEIDQKFWRYRRASGLRGILRPPGDKSISHRAIMLGALATGRTHVEGWLPADDCLRTVQIFIRLGVAISSSEQDGTSIEIEGRGLSGLSAPASTDPLDCGNSGTTLRLTLGILAGNAFKVVLTGDDSLRGRPMRRIIEPLRAMGARIDAAGDGDHAPIEIEGGNITGRNFDLPVASAQLKSSLLLAGLQANGITRVREPVPSRDHTERQLVRLGAAYKREADGWHCVTGGISFAGLPMRIPGDISSAAPFLAAASICPRSEIEIQGVGINHGRSGFIEILRRMGARISVTNEREVDGEPVADLILKGGAALKGARVSGELVPRLLDEIPVLAALACYADGVTVIRDAAELRVKESDRLAAMAQELQKMGAKVGILPDGLAIEGVGGASLKGTNLESHGDHRVAQALAVAALGADGETTIHSVECVATSYPNFEKDLHTLTGDG